MLRSLLIIKERGRKGKTKTAMYSRGVFKLCKSRGAIPSAVHAIKNYIAVIHKKFSRICIPFHI